MRSFFYAPLFLALSILSLSAAHADQFDPQLAPLFAQLRSGEGDADQVQFDIEILWLDAPEAGVQILVENLAKALEAGDIAPASVLASHITGLAPQFAEGWILMGHAALLNGDMAVAEGAFRNALVLEPRHYNALANLGDIALDAGDRDDAFQFFRRALDLNPYMTSVREKADQIRFERDGREI